MQQVMTGNKAAATAAKLCRPEILAVYPITPQTTLLEYLCEFVARGELNATMVEVESEHSVMSVLAGAAKAGGRTFTGTSGQGLLYMCEPYVSVSTSRLPMVMVIVNREIISPTTVWGGHQDAMTLRDAGWIQIYVEDNQEILDAVIMAFKLAEDPQVLLPVNVCYDGFYLSHTAGVVEVPSQKDVDRFLPPYKQTHMTLDPENPMSVDPLMPSDLLTEYRYKHVEALERAKQKIVEVDLEFGRTFGRFYGGLIEGYRSDDADYVIVAMGSATGTARVAVDQARDKGIPFGLVKLRAFRPFPAQELVEVFRGKKAVGFLDRNVCFGWNSGILYMEASSAIGSAGLNIPRVDFIGGLGGADITLKQLNSAIEIVVNVADRGLAHEVHWLGLE